MISPSFRRVSWLLGLALATLLNGCHPAQNSARSLSNAQATTAPWFRDVAQTAGLTFAWGPRDPSNLTILDEMGYGCAFLDYDGDGKLDILLVAKDHIELFRNKGDGSFENVTDQAFPHQERKAYLMGCSVCDYDGDGKPDIFVTGYGRTILYHNQGNGTFKDVTAGSGLEARGPYDWTTSACWADMDGDGKPDLYVCRYVQFTPSSKQLCQYEGLDGSMVSSSCTPAAYPSEQGSLYRNEGGGKFRDITRESGLADTHGNGLGCMFCDFNDDGKPDLYIANDTRPADLFVNLGNGRFKNIAAESGTAYASDGKIMSGMGIDWGDYDNDGRFDLLVSNFSNQAKALFHNQGHNVFTDEAGATGIVMASMDRLTFGANFVDVDNDGWLDIVLMNGHVWSLADRIENAISYYQSAQLFHNEGGQRFTDMTAQVGPDFTRKIVGRGVAVGDYDGDGRQDLLIVNLEGTPLLLHNEGPRRHFLNLRCLGPNGKSDALGARVTLKAGTLTQIREVRASGTYLSCDAPTLHFGLGDSRKADEITIRWPDGKMGSFRSVDADRTYLVSEADGRLRTVP